ncbi:MAG: hypothetical protein D3916_06380 [Candidatus Electrothrix sp. MAN1_4]|nr:hypothetical protein [Candidatus Electrothrix sp. MAN1_4]
MIVDCQGGILDNQYLGYRKFKLHRVEMSLSDDIPVLVECLTCHSKIASDAVTCPACGTTKPFHERKILLRIISNIQRDNYKEEESLLWYPYSRFNVLNVGNILKIGLLISLLFVFSICPQIITQGATEYNIGNLLTVVCQNMILFISIVLIGYPFVSVFKSMELVNIYYNNYFFRKNPLVHVLDFKFQRYHATDSFWKKIIHDSLDTSSNVDLSKEDKDHLIKILRYKFNISVEYLTSLGFNFNSKKIVKITVKYIFALALFLMYTFFILILMFFIVKFFYNKINSEMLEKSLLIFNVDVNSVDFIKLKNIQTMDTLLASTSIYFACSVVISQIFNCILFYQWGCRVYSRYEKLNKNLDKFLGECN